MVHIALLRGINVGGRNKLPMNSLVSMFNDAGCTNVRTYIQSGNVVFEAEPALVRQIPFIITESIFEHFGFNIPVVTRSADELSKIVRANPFLRAGTDERALHVAFLDDVPDPARLETLDPDRSTPDEFIVLGREIYLQCPNGLARTKLTNRYFDSKLETTSTLRNWKTTLKLFELSAA
jgi:uncharacterized protein (DUF1697 family)